MIFSIDAFIRGRVKRSSTSHAALILSRNNCISIRTMVRRRIWPSTVRTVQSLTNRMKKVESVASLTILKYEILVPYILN